MLEIVQLWRVGAKLICQGIKTKIYLKGVGEIFKIRVCLNTPLVISEFTPKNKIRHTLVPKK